MIELSEKRLKELANEKDEFCSFCGQKLICSIVGAETETLYYGNLPTIPVGSAYDRETGRRQYIKKYICPTYKEGLIKIKKNNSHDNYYKNKIIVI